MTRLGVPRGDVVARGGKDDRPGRPPHWATLAHWRRGLTTFSTMQVELLRMLDARHYGLATGYASASIAGGYAAVHLSTAMVRRIRMQA